MVLLKLLKLNIFLLGCFALFAIPSYKNFILSHLFLISSFLTSFALFLHKEYKLSKNDIFLLSLALLFYSSTLIGALNSGMLSGIITSQIFIVTAIVILISNKITYCESNYLFLKGFVISAVLTGVYVIIDFLYFIENFQTLNELIFPEFLLSKAGEHSFINLHNIFGIVLYRPTGFSWDPGLTITGVVVAVVLLKENLVKIKFRKLIILILVISILISQSKTSIIALSVYLIMKIFQLEKYTFKINDKYINSLSIFTIAIFLVFLYIGIFIDYEGQGDVRHLKYLSSIFYYPEANILELLFGYGYTGVGVFFNKYVDWLSASDFNFGENLNPESTLTNIFFYGGIIGSLFWIVSYVWAFITSKNNIRYVLLILLILAFGYTINSVWFNALYFSLLSLLIDNKMCLNVKNIY